MNITQFILIVALFNFILSIFVLKSNFKNPLNKSFSLCAFLLGLWVLLNYLFQKSNSITILRSIYALAPFIILSAVLWITYLKYKKLDKKIIHTNIILVFINLFFAYLMFTNNNMISSVTNYYKYSTGYLFNIYTYYIVMLFLGFLIYLIVEYRKSDTYYRKQLKLITIGMFFVVIISAVVGFVLPAIGITRFNVLDSPSSIIFVLCGAYSIMRHELLDIKSAAAEIIAYALAILMFVVLFVVDEAGFSLKVLVLLLILFGSYTLIKNIQKELASKKHIEKLNRQLKQDKKDLLELDRMKNEFLQMATHELNTPITAIQGKLDMAVRENLCKLDSEQKAFLEPILNQTTRLGHLSNDILNTARIDQRRLPINRSETDLDALISDTVKNFEIKAKEQGDSIAYIPMSKSLPKLNVDQSKIGEVITNLINNAIKFTEKGKIAVTSKIKDDEVIISVSDTGVGIDKEGQKHLFEKFYQANRFNPDDPQEQQGTGLGLYISRNIVELHGGKMGLISDKDKGSTFYFSLPLEYKKDEAKNSDISHNPLEAELTSGKTLPTNTEIQDITTMKTATADTNQSPKPPINNPDQSTENPTKAS